MNTFAQKMAGGAVKQTRQSAQAIAKRIAQEQLETLRSAKIQVGLPASEKSSAPNMEGAPAPTSAEVASGESNAQLSERLNLESKRLLENLEAELAAIRHKKEQEQLQIKQSEEQQKVIEVRENQSKVQEAPTLMGKMRKAVGGMKKKVQNMAGKREQQKNVSG